MKYKSKNMSNDSYQSLYSKESYYNWLTDPNSREKFLVVVLERTPEEGSGYDVVTLKIKKKDEIKFKEHFAQELEYAEVVNDGSLRTENFINKILNQINTALA